MKLGRQKGNEAQSFNRPAINQTKRNGLVGAIIVVTILLIAWVVIMGQKAEKTVKIVMLADNIYKNQVITAELLKPYDVLQGEFDKYAVVESGGTKKRRLILWDERKEIINSFAAYPLKKDSYAEYRDFIKSRVSNSDNVLYSFPGKNIVPLTIGSSEMDAFKTFIKPGDRLNIKAIFSQKAQVLEDDGMGGTVKNQTDMLKTETVFGDIMIADLLNNRGESILDIYSNYRDLSVWEQAKLDSDSSFKEKTQPKSLLVALTPEEEARYNYYLSKSGITFKVSMPQRIQ